MEFPARLRGGRQLLGGLANLEWYLTEVNGEPFEGVSLRLFNPASEEWTIYWMDDRGAALVEQVVGSFIERDGERVFVGYGTETYLGDEVRMRFVWAGIGSDTSRWEQAYWDEEHGDWETNWVMEFTRTGGEPFTKR